MNAIDTSFSFHSMTESGFSLTQSPLAIRRNYGDVWPVRATNTFGYAKLEWAHIESRLAEIAQLGTGWHGAGSSEICEQVLSRVRIALQAAARAGMPRSEITPHANGTVSLEWETSRLCIFAEVGRTRINSFIRHADGTTVILPEMSDLSEYLLHCWAGVLEPVDRTFISIGCVPSFGLRASVDTEPIGFIHDGGPQFSGALQLPAA